MKTLPLFCVLLVVFVLGWMPGSVLSSVMKSFPDSNTDAKAFNLPKISQARGRLVSGRDLSQESVVFIDTKNSIAQTDPQFLSLTIDAGHIRHNWSGINFTAPRIQNMAMALTPAMLRVGGTSGDDILFNNTQRSSNGESNPLNWFTFLFVYFCYLSRNVHCSH